MPPPSTTPIIVGPAPSGDTPFPVEAVLSGLATRGITFTANYTDTQGNTFDLSDATRRADDAMFETISRRSVGQTISVRRNGSPISSIVEQTYFSISPLQYYGSVAQSGAYSVVTASTPLPVTAKAGDQGAIYTARVYSASDKRTVTGSRQVNWSVEADTATTVFLCTLTVNSQPSGNITDSRKVCHKINTSGNIVGYTFRLNQNGTSVTFG
ncbi:MAG: hypothetical protein ACK5NY_09945 [Burkholderiaceae bacterium]